MAKIPQQPKTSETAPGHVHINQIELQTYGQEMKQFRALFTEAVSNCDPNNPDEIISTLASKLANASVKR